MSAICTPALSCDWTKCIKSITEPICRRLHRCPMPEAARPCPSPQPPVLSTCRPPRLSGLASRRSSPRGTATRSRMGIRAIWTITSQQNYAASPLEDLVSAISALAGKSDFGRPGIETGSGWLFPSVQEASRDKLWTYQ